jgi:hypothetical protein
MFMNETFMKRQHRAVESQHPCLPPFDNFSAPAGKTYGRELRSVVHRSNESKMQNLMWNERDVSALANKRQRGSMLRCGCLLA